MMLRNKEMQTGAQAEARALRQDWTQARWDKVLLWLQDGRLLLSRAPTGALRTNQTAVNVTKGARWFDLE
jgi:hypothetical protein